MVMLCLVLLILKQLETIHNQGLIIFSQYLYSPIQSLHVEASQPLLYVRFDKLCVQHALKLRQNPDPPCHVFFIPQFYEDNFYATCLQLDLIQHVSL